MTIHRVWKSSKVWVGTSDKAQKLDKLPKHIQDELNPTFEKDPTNIRVLTHIKHYKGINTVTKSLHYDVLLRNNINHDWRPYHVERELEKVTNVDLDEWFPNEGIIDYGDV